MLFLDRQLLKGLFSHSDLQCDSHLGSPLSGLRIPLPRVQLLAACAVAVVLATLVLARAQLGAEELKESGQEREPISITADFGEDFAEEKWSSRAWVLRGNCQIKQGETTLSAQKAVVWVATDKRQRERLYVYLEGDVRWERADRTTNEQTLALELSTRSGVKFNVRRKPVAAENPEQDPFYKFAADRRSAAKKRPAQPTQLIDLKEGDVDSEIQMLHVQPLVSGVRRLRVFQRSAIPYNVQSFESPNTVPPEQVWILSDGVNLVIDGVDGTGTMDLSADRMVIWTQTAASQKFTSEMETLQSKDTPLQVYLEGNIIARQGTTKVKAKQAFYDALEHRAIILDAELKVVTPNLPLAVRIRAEKLRQLSQSSFRAENAWISTSKFGKPGYRVQASDLMLEERPTTKLLSGSKLQEDSDVSVAEPETTPWATMLNSKFMVNDTPVFYWPYASAPANNTNTAMRQINVQQDRIFGTQVHTQWNLLKIFGMDQPAGARFDLLADYLSRRGPAAGLSGDYRGNDLFGMPGEYFTTGLAYYVHDSGTDNLGLDRRRLEPKDPSRGRLLLRHRQEINPDTLFMGELGYLSDRNFLEQYYKKENDTGKDNETLGYLKTQRDNWALSVLGRAQLNDFDTTTQWFPKFDANVLAQPLFGGALTWSSHSSAGLASLNPAVAPTDPHDIFTPLPFVTQAQGAVLMTRHELNAPLQLGPVNVVPYVMGDASYWSEDMQGNPLMRLYGSAGVRSSVMFWKAYPQVRSEILGLQGLAHKMTINADFSISESNQDLSLIPQYNEFDDQAQYRFRDRLLLNTFGGTLPAQFDPRFYAVRAGAASSVTAPYNELVASQEVLRLSWKHRLQTKEGPLDNPRIKDWMLLDLGASYFPNAKRDDFGQSFGLLNANYIWNVGDRTSLLASAYYDLFDNAQQLWSVGVNSQRTTRGSVYMGVRQVKGAGLDSKILTASYSYAMSPKWNATVATAYDLAENRNRGQSLMLTRVGADFLMHFGGNFDPSTNNAGVAISIEPRFLPFMSQSSSGGSPQMGSLLGGN